MKLEDAIKTTRFTNEKHRASLNVIYTAYWLKDQLSTAMKSNGITTEQYNILRILKGKYPEKMCVKDISNRMIEKSSNVPRIIDRLVIKKLVKRSTSRQDKRETLVALTESGIKLLTDSNEIVNNVNETYINLTEEEAQNLNNLLEKMRNTL